jgi:hypothetical protein
MSESSWETQKHKHTAQRQHLVHKLVGLLASVQVEIIGVAETKHARLPVETSRDSTALL